MEDKKRVLSCIQPSGMLTLGNYLGALKNWQNMSREFDCIFAVADLHAITVRQEPSALRKQIYDTFALLLALGLDPNENILFLQSNVSQHAELAWLLSCYTQFGELNRMTQFKDKSKTHADNINLGLFAYPTLMAADILLYKPDLVPVGDDQKQHLEITRDIANRFNGIYGDVFTVPEAYIGKATAKIMSLQDPTKKMSKSDENPNASIYLMDDPDTIIRKCKRAVTDSEAQILYRDEQPGVKNLIDIYSACTNKSQQDVVKEFDGKGYGDFKMAVGEACADALAPVQAEFKRLMQDKKYLEDMMAKGAMEAHLDSLRTMSKVRRKIGFIEKPRF